MPAAASCSGNKQSPIVGTAGLRTPAEQGIIVADVQEQCLSAQGWLKGLAEERHGEMQTPVSLSPSSYPVVQVCLPLCILFRQHC